MKLITSYISCYKHYPAGVLENNQLKLNWRRRIGVDVKM
jgi:hypothetical protein